jgi:HK97 family phage major capsid protein
MRTKSIAQVQKDLQILANQFGADGFEAAKANYFKSCTVENDAGELVDPSTIEVEVTFTKSAEPKADDIAGIVAKTVREEIAKAVPQTVSKAARIEVGGDERRKSVRRGVSKFVRDAETAHDFGRWIQAVTFGNKAKGAVDHCRSKGLGLTYGYFDDNDQFHAKATGHSEGNNVDGGFLVPDEFDTEIVWLREQYGVFRRNARIKPMLTDAKSFSRKTSSHSAYWVGEGATNTTSKMQFDPIKLVAKKLRTDGYLTEELSEDAAVALGDEAAQDIAWAFAYQEDLAGFLGDGTSTYGGIQGLNSKLLGLSGTIANIAGAYDASTNDFATLVIGDFHGTMARLPQYAKTTAKWYCSSTFYELAMQRLAAGVGGVTMTEIKNGVPQQYFLGHPVEIAQVLPSANPSANTVVCWFGDLSQAAYLGDRRGITFKTTDVGGNAWNNDEIAYKATERLDIVCANLGNASATASARVPGPLVGLVITP